ncbi:hypothetical protein EJ04DRAFT_337374 [Polyplosphaeria fusca]|uniref:Uncharacterized protein n=1 Tax=Polyplosphaeria fusca TaxID=682080 RepID=A0A9P4QWI2_9PLEO|nr:hypothetical protein EJ04DRAFT_337374 [Polyplosphaeria fusca]
MSIAQDTRNEAQGCPAQPADCRAQSEISTSPLAADAPRNALHSYIPDVRAILKRSLSLLVLSISIIALWGSISSAIDSHRAAQIAEWTSQKDFREFCEEV